ncbi:MAG: M3 family metallopeptidase [Gemmatimonadales bacterium]|nr:M3 family metallopeptidase [Gemmatimonadales bacterium]
MTADELRSRGERMCEELGRETYRAGAGLTSETHFEEIFARYADLAGEDAWEAARGHRELFEWVVENRVGRAVAALDDRLHAWESAAEVAANGGERMPYQRVAIAIANEPRRERRLLLDAARRKVLGAPSSLRRERLETERELLAPLGDGDHIAARAALMGIDLDALGVACGRFLDQTKDLYFDLLTERLRAELSLSPGDAERSDSAFLFRGASFDDAFPAPDLVPVARRQVGEMGLDAEAAGRIRYDTEDRERKRPRAFCAPVQVPDEIYLVIRPHGGHVDYRAFFHELGHALHFANAGRALAFEHRWLGDNSVTECYAMLFEHVLLEPAWLTRYTALRGERLAAFLRAQHFALLAIMRRYAAKLRYELELHRAPSLDAGAGRYAEFLTEATGFRYAGEDALLDLDDGFYAARYLRSWQLEATLRAQLRERFDEDWFRNPRSGPAVMDLLARGQREDAATLARSACGAELSFAPLVAACEAALG